MNVTHSSTRFAVFFIGVAALVMLRPSGVRAQAAPDHASAKTTTDARSEMNGNAGALIKIVREATERFQDVDVAKAEGYALQFGCVSGSDAGAMGMHFVNGALVGDGELDPARPEIVIYEPLPGGKLKLIGADYLVLTDAWDKKPHGHVHRVPRHAERRQPFGADGAEHRHRRSVAAHAGSAALYAAQPRHRGGRSDDGSGPRDGDGQVA
jgi:hypothetical protein